MSVKLVTLMVASTPLLVSCIFLPMSAEEKAGYAEFHRKTESPATYEAMDCWTFLATKKSYEQSSHPSMDKIRQVINQVAAQRDCSPSESTIATTEQTASATTATTTLAPPLPVAAPPVAQAPTPAPAKPEKNRTFCLAFMGIENTYGAVASPIQEKHDNDGSGAAMQASLKSYVEQVKQVQPGIWGEFNFDATTCASNTNVCMAQTEGGLFTKKQTAFQFCHFTLTEAEAELKQLRAGDPSLKTIAWP